MAQIMISRISRLVLMAVAIVVADSAAAGKPSWAGGGKHEKHSKKERYYDGDNGKGYYDDRNGPSFTGGMYFNDQHYKFVQNYFGNYYRSGHCPPGLAKKNNGCMPPGQAKKWAIGQPLPQGMVYSNLPAELARGLGMPPQGYRYVQAASDILMIAINSGIVTDAINGMGR